MKKKYFISYASEEFIKADRLFEELIGLGHDVWLDRKMLSPGNFFWERIKEAIKNYDSLLLCLSPTSVNSSWVQKEYEVAIDKSKEIIPILFADCIIPEYLKKHSMVYMRNAEEWAQGLNELITYLCDSYQTNNNLASTIDELKWLEIFLYYELDIQEGKELFQRYKRVSYHLTQPEDLKDLLEYFFKNSQNKDIAIQHFKSFFLRFPFSLFNRYKKWMKFVQHHKLSFCSDKHSFALRMTPIDPDSVTDIFYKNMQHYKYDENIAWTWTMVQKAGGLAYEL